MGGYVAVCKSNELEEGRGKAVEVDGLRIAVFRDQGDVYALLGRCPHSNGPLGQGTVENGQAVCPLHRWHFRLQDGVCTTIPGHTLHRFPCEERDGEVWVRA
jgi:NAD(P)H-dependent nitrite reductase small subunit